MGKCLLYRFGECEKLPWKKVVVFFVASFGRPFVAVVPHVLSTQLRRRNSDSINCLDLRLICLMHKIFWRASTSLKSQTISTFFKSSRYKTSTPQYHYYSSFQNIRCIDPSTNFIVARFSTLSECIAFIRKRDLAKPSSKNDSITRRIRSSLSGNIPVVYGHLWDADRVQFSPEHRLAYSNLERKSERARNKRAFSHNYILEWKARIAVREAIEDTFEVVDSPPGCVADMLIRPIGSSEDSWYPLQVKTSTIQANRKATFRFRKLLGYSHDLHDILCVGFPSHNSPLSDALLWHFHSDDLTCESPAVTIGRRTDKEKRLSFGDLSDFLHLNMKISCFPGVPSHPNEMYASLRSMGRKTDETFT